MASPANAPTATVSEDVVCDNSAFLPIATLLEPVVHASNALPPTAVL